MQNEWHFQTSKFSCFYVLELQLARKILDVRKYITTLCAPKVLKFGAGSIQCKHQIGDLILFLENALRISRYM